MIGRRHEVLLWGGGGTNLWATKPTYRQNLVSPIEFRPIYFENIGKCKMFVRVKKIR